MNMMAQWQAPCVCIMVQTIVVVISDTPGFEETKINMGLSRFGQRFGVCGEFVNELEVQMVRNSPKINYTSGAAWKIS